jgi:hypothetical protein
VSGKRWRYGRRISLAGLGIQHHLSFRHNLVLSRETRISSQALAAEGAKVPWLNKSKGRLRQMRYSSQAQCIIDELRAVGVGVDDWRFCERDVTAACC